jgi:predicted aspartyl protease
LEIMMRGLRNAFLAVVLIGLPVTSFAKVSQSTTMDLSAEAPIIELAAVSEEEALHNSSLDRDHFARWTLPVTINGAGPFDFMVDTGAQTTVITHGVADTLALEPNGSANLMALGGSRLVETVELNGLEFADHAFDSLTVPLLERLHVGADGIIGLDVLGNLRVLFDFTNDSLMIAPAQERASNLGYEIVVRGRRKSGRMIVTDADIDGVKTALIIDTGAQTSYGNDALRRKLRARHIAMAKSTDVNGIVLNSSFTLAGTLRIASVAVSPISVGYSQSPVFAQLDLEDRPALLLGMEGLRGFDRVAIDFNTGKILFDLPREESLMPLPSFEFVP